MKDNDNSIFFLTISLICVWLIVDYVVGKKYLGKFISMLPFMSGSDTSSISTMQTAIESEKNLDPNSEDAQNRFVSSQGHYYQGLNPETLARPSTSTGAERQEDGKLTLNEYKDAISDGKYSYEVLDQRYHASGGRQGKCYCKELGKK